MCIEYTYTYFNQTITLLCIEYTYTINNPRIITPTELKPNTIKKPTQTKHQHNQKINSFKNQQFQKKKPTYFKKNKPRVFLQKPTVFKKPTVSKSQLFFEKKKKQELKKTNETNL